MKLDTTGLKNRIAEGQKITKWEFDRLMVRGWKERRKKYVSGVFESLDRSSYCAIGVVANELGMGSYDFAKKGIPNRQTWTKIARASNAAGTKTKAIEAVKAVQW